MNLMQMGLAMQAASIGKKLADYEPNTPRGNHGVLKPRADDSVTGTPSPAAASDPDLFNVEDDEEPEQREPDGARESRSIDRDNARHINRRYE